MDSAVLRCPYPVVRRRNSTCEAPGTMFRQLEATSRLWTRGSSGRVSESESSYGRPVTRHWRKWLARQDQKVRGMDRAVLERATVLNDSRRVIDGTHPRTLESSPINRVSPTYPTPTALAVVSRPQGTGMVQGVKDAGASEGRTVMVRIGPREREYPTRKGADFRLVFLGRESYGRPNPGGG